MADVFEDRRDLDAARARLWQLIEVTPALDWQLLTKRPERVCALVPHEWRADAWPRNVWLGTTVEDQRRAEERIPLLIAARARVRFLSCEPLLGLVALPLDGISWVIVGGESGRRARHCHVEWIADIVAQCAAAAVPCFVKQLGTRPTADDRFVTCHAPAARDPAEWPESLRVRQFPRTEAPCAAPSTR